jgi:tetratricopeptide (TPR) repeat protein
MTRRRYLLPCGCVLALIFAIPAAAQFVPPDVQAADVTLAKYQAMLASYGSMEAAIRQISLEKSQSQRTLAEMARRLKVRSPDLRPAEVLAALDRMSDDLTALRLRLFEIEGGDSPAVAALRRRAARSFNELRFEEAEQLLMKVVELRRTEIAKRRNAQDLANDEAQVQLVMDIIAQARFAGSRTDYDRQIALYLLAIKEAPARRPAIVGYIKGMLGPTYYLKGLNLRDLAAARAALDIVQGVRAEATPKFRFLLWHGEAEARLLIAELDPTRDNLVKAVDASRTLYHACRAKKESSGAAVPDFESFEFGECLATTGARGVAVARDLLIRASLMLGQLWRDNTAIVSTETLLQEAITDPR